MIILLTILHVLIAILLVVAVLMQSGKGGGLAASLGGGLSSSSVLGGRTAATFLSKTTTGLATAFLLSCLLQSFLWSGSEEVVLTATERLLQEGQTQPAPYQESMGAADQGENPSVLGGDSPQPSGEGDSGE